MIDKVSLRYFKLFEQQDFSLADSIILAGPNNSGKSTLLQAIAAWDLALRKWLAERGPGSGSKASKRTGVPITRKDFTAIPLREMNLLWHDRSTGLSKEELKGDKKLGTPRLIEIDVFGSNSKGRWKLAFEFRYGIPEMVYVKPSQKTPIEEVLDIVESLQVVHVPPFSGIGAEETRYDKAYQNLLIGQGKPGDILRNLLLEVSKEKSLWNELSHCISDIFGYRLFPPKYEGGPFITCEYQHDTLLPKSEKSHPRFDIASAGSGFLQVLMLLGFIYARPASILLLDEPDAHLHIILQKQVYDLLRDIAHIRGCQIIIATHSEVLVDSTSPDRILSFFKEPHILSAQSQRDQVREALKYLTSSDFLAVEDSPGILYVESETDLNLLREWSGILKHDAYDFLRRKPFWYNIKSREPRAAKNHFFALKALHEDIKGIIILDGDNRDLPDHEIAAEGLTILRWHRYESESYLIHPAALKRFVESASPDLFTTASAERAIKYLSEQVPKAVLDNPLSDIEFLNYTPASKTLLPGFFSAAGIPITKNEYYRIAAQMQPDEIPDEIKKMLDNICTVFDI